MSLTQNRFISFCLTGMILLFCANTLQAQKEFTYLTFRGTRVINGHSVEVGRGGDMTFWISHRFGPLSDGLEGLFGFDDASIRIGLDYAVNDRILIGIGRSGIRQTYDGFLKARLFRQVESGGGLPFSLSGLATIAIEGQDPPQGREDLFTNRLTYTYQLLLARKFGDRFSLQFMPTIVHRNLVETDNDNNDVIAIGVAPRIQVSKNIALTAEYYYTLPDQLAEDISNFLSIALEIDTKGHVFQFSVSNARGMIEKFFVTETSGDWSLDNLRLGFNITRGFRVKGRNAFN